jgi:hypothetical protein
MAGDCYVVSVSTLYQAFRLVGRKANAPCTLDWEAQHSKLAMVQHQRLAIPQGDAARTARWLACVVLLLMSLSGVGAGIVAQRAPERKTGARPAHGTFAVCSWHFRAIAWLSPLA